MGNKNETLRIEAPNNLSVLEVDKFRKELYGYIGSGNHNFIIDFNQCQFLDSTGLGVLIGVYKRCMEAGGKIILENLNEDVMKVFRLTRLDKIFDIK